MKFAEMIINLSKGIKIAHPTVKGEYFMLNDKNEVITSVGGAMELNTSSEYALYEEVRPDFIDKTVVLLEELGEEVIETCTYECEKCPLDLYGNCLKDELDDLVSRYHAKELLTELEKYDNKPTYVTIGKKDIPKVSIFGSKEDVKNLSALFRGVGIE